MDRRLLPPQGDDVVDGRRILSRSARRSRISACSIWDHTHIDLPDCIAAPSRCRGRRVDV